MEKKAVLAVSFGTSYREVIESCIVPVERAISDALCGWDFYRAFTSGMITKKLAQKESIFIDRPPEALKKLYEAGYTDIIVQPTHILAGTEYHDLKAQTEEFSCAHTDICVRFGQPVLFENEDYERAARALQNHMPHTQAGEIVLLMGHGSEHFSNASYFALQHYLNKLPTQAVYVANVEAPPLLDTVIEELKQKHIKKVYLMPFMLVAGDHAKNDMAGDDDDSWRSRLLKAGFETEIILKGLGESPDFAEIYREKARKNLLRDTVHKA